MEIAHLQEGMRMYLRTRRVKKKGLHRYAGNAREICSQIVEDCWNGNNFQTSTDYGHFSGFYMRDFGWAVSSLVQLGHTERVLKTLEYVLQRFSVAGLTTTITPSGKCIDVFRYAPDSIAYLVHCLKVAKAEKLIIRYRHFLEEEARKCFSLCFDPSISLVCKDHHFGSIKDSTYRYSSTYDNTMLVMLSRDLSEIGLKNPFQGYNIKQAMLERLWNEKKGYWYDDLRQYDVVTGDSNTFPYWTKVFDSADMIKSSIRNVQNAGLVNPFPIKYSNQKAGKEYFWRKWLAPNYQTRSIKTHMGGLFIHAVKPYDSSLARAYTDRYAAFIEEYGTYLENFSETGKPFNSRFYFADEGNIWAANFLTL